jgi:flagellar biosynthesis protein FliR
VLISIAQAQLFFLALTRIMAIIIQVPILGGRSVPNNIKLGLGLMLTIVMIPWQPLPSTAEAIPLIEFSTKIFTELLIGTLAGFAAVLTFSAIEIAGNIMGVASGFSAGQILNPAMEGSGSSMDQIFIVTAMLIFVVTNAHHSFLLGLQRTFVVLPINSPLPDFSLDRLLDLTKSLIAVGIQLAFPVMGTLLLTDLTMGMIAKVAPQVHVFFLGVPLKIGIGLLVLGLALSILLPTISQIFQTLGKQALRLLGA